jgi:hypothetical protein
MGGKRWALLEAFAECERDLPRGAIVTTGLEKPAPLQGIALT